MRLSAYACGRYDGAMNMSEPFDDPPPHRARGYNVLEYLLGAAAGCVVASFVAVGVFVLLAKSGALREDSLSDIITIVAASPVVGAISGGADPSEKWEAPTLKRRVGCLSTTTQVARLN